MNEKLSRSVAGKVTVITGAASGMGRATAGVFADEGAPLSLIHISEPTRLWSGSRMPSSG